MIGLKWINRLIIPLKLSRCSGRNSRSFCFWHNSSLTSKLQKCPCFCCLALGYKNSTITVLHSFLPSTQLNCTNRCLTYRQIHLVFITIMRWRNPWERILIIKLCHFRLGSICMAISEDWSSVDLQHNRNNLSVSFHLLNWRSSSHKVAICITYKKYSC